MGKGGGVSLYNMMKVALKLYGLAIKFMPFIEMIHLQHNPVAILGALRNAVVSKVRGWIVVARALDDEVFIFTKGDFPLKRVWLVTDNRATEKSNVLPPA